MPFPTRRRKVASLSLTIAVMLSLATASGYALGNQTPDISSPSNTAVTYSLVDAYTDVSTNSTAGVVTVTNTASPTSSDTQLPLTLTTGNLYTVSVLADDIADFSGMVFVIEYDPLLLEVDDLCILTWAKETTAGAIPGTGITIVSFTPGEIVFEIDRNIPNDKVFSGLINAIRFRALDDGEAVITLSEATSSSTLGMI